MTLYRLKQIVDALVEEFGKNEKEYPKYIEITSEIPPVPTDVELYAYNYLGHEYIVIEI